jgi:hypothetical protein
MWTVKSVTVFVHFIVYMHDSFMSAWLDLVTMMLVATRHPDCPWELVSTASLLAQSALAS